MLAEAGVAESSQGWIFVSAACELVSGCSTVATGGLVFPHGRHRIELNCGSSSARGVAVRKGDAMPYRPNLDPAPAPADAGAAVTAAGTAAREKRERAAHEAHTREALPRCDVLNAQLRCLLASVYSCRPSSS